ncbi:MAG: bifunctional adenosylcobinamide kinase/adenosylcobinamide-phosphate guanylyltransferase [Prevotella sp.]|nr:bifunctional adenosylcobinamide kinase/adenosylcobinamide-phosphate guanylyltransferase [Prevotella sp.]
MKRIILITGGQRSGKSRYAEELALKLSNAPVYMATARIWDDEFRERVDKHRQRRGSQWTSIEEEQFLSRYDVEGKVVVIDCITLWCTNFLFNHHAAAKGGGSGKEGGLPEIEPILKEMQVEFDLFTRQDATFIFVTNEIGCGGVSENALQRRFTDLQGWMNQYVAARADDVVWMSCGIPVFIKQGKQLLDLK